MPSYICQSNVCFNSKEYNYGRFNSDATVEACPLCGSDDIVWCPPRYNGDAKAVDATLRRVADQYKLSDMGQRGGTRAGECVKQSRPNVTPDRVVSVDGFNVPVSSTGEITSSWSTTALPTKLKPGGLAQPYAGLAPARGIPTNVVHNFKGK